MTRLTSLNWAGVVALVVLCVFQWQRDRDLHLELSRLDQVRIDQASRIVQQEQGLLGLGSDLSHFKHQFTHVLGETTGLQTQLRIAEQEVLRLKAEREHLTNSLAQWVSAVALRDATLKDVNAQVADLTERLNTSIAQFNQLASNHNALVKRFNESRPPPLAPPASKL